MRLKSFTAKTVPEAMRKVRDQLGPDAVILSTQNEEGGQVRITAALEEPEQREEINGYTDSLRAIDDIGKALSYHRLPSGLEDRLIAAASGVVADDPTMVLAAALDAEIDFAPLNQRLCERPLLLAGPAGAGKSAMAAKLCAWAKLLELEAFIISMDLVKAGATTQIGTYATALDARLDQASDGEDLQLALDEVPLGAFVVIDTAGVNPFDQHELAQLAELKAIAKAALALVLPAGGDTLESAETALAFRDTGADAMIATKLDAARRYGGILSAACAGRLPLIAGGTSPNIGDGLTTLNPVTLARLMLPAEAPSAAVLASGTNG